MMQVNGHFGLTAALRRISQSVSVPDAGRPQTQVLVKFWSCPYPDRGNPRVFGTMAMWAPSPYFRTASIRR